MKTKALVDLRKGFPLERPAIQLRWGLEEERFRQQFAETRVAVAQVTAGHLRARCGLLGGLDTDIHFHFAPRREGRFFQVELYRRPSRGRQRGFDDWQARLTALLGPGSEQPQRAPVDTSFRWKLGRVDVVHEWYVHSGEHERILFTCKTV